MKIFLIVMAATLCMGSISACSNTATSQSETPRQESGQSDSKQQPEQLAIPTFNADSAMADLRAQVGLGPRVPGTKAHAAFIERAVAKLKGYGATVDVQRATVNNPLDGSPVAISNIQAAFNLTATNRVMILAHYDTRPWADEDPVESNRNRPIDGANDGASGVAVIMELARLMSQQSPAIGVDLLLVDAEDSGKSAPDGAGYDEAVRYEKSWCLGSRYWAENQPGDRVRPRYAILLDMVGGRNANFYREAFSEAHAKHVNDKVWGEAAKMGLTMRFRNDVGGAINDDHLPLLNAGIPAIDIIEIGHDETGAFNPTWHTLNDNIDNIDPTTIGMVGQLITNIIYKEK